MNAAILIEAQEKYGDTDWESYTNRRFPPAGISAATEEELEIILWLMDGDGLHPDSLGPATLADIIRWAAGEDHTDVPYSAGFLINWLLYRRYNAEKPSNG
jgi:hypothetical protein